MVEVVKVLHWYHHHMSQSCRVPQPTVNRLTITAGVYLGSDDYVTVKKCFGGVYKEYRQLNECEIPTKVFYRSCADEKQRRVDTGNSSARSICPIPDAPEHSTLLGNMMIISTGPAWTVDNTKN